MKKLIIEIEECDYEVIKRECSNKDVVPIGWVQILNGTPLPKGHGDLIDRSKLLVELECGIRAGNYEEGYEKYPHINDMDDCFDTVKYADTIIEADKENK